MSEWNSHYTDSEMLAMLKELKEKVKAAEQTKASFHALGGALQKMEKAFMPAISTNPDPESAFWD